ncbi:PadR family transcriptional regulator [Candidatus Lokiarchaeum ossiferum]|uniref:PadR family transcriptional regulator n=1 Tax=Candidatus Lokiarchaeum ossiferum TaxID=2951803 RepID=UPI00352DB283
MIKHVKSFRDDSLLSEELFRNYTEIFESETLRGITTLCVIRIIMDSGDEGTYGYELIRILKEKSANILAIEEGRLYPLLKNLEKWGKAGQEIQIIRSDKRKIGNRIRKYYTITKKGKQLYFFWEGLFSNILDSISSLIDIKIANNAENFFFCPNCHNKIEFSLENANYCGICGFQLKSNT